MAVFDPKQQRMCVRIVYDGVASAGKTTNLQQLAELFATQRTCELLSPAEMEGRTLYFDWLQIAAGVVSGFPLLCQVISVPGQVVLTPRRRYLLSTADAVVHVCDSDEHGAPRAREGLGLFDEVETARGDRIPLVVQANKQDRAGALGGAAVLAALGRTHVPVVEAIASDGVGVLDTFVAAVRAVVRSIQARVESGYVRVAVRVADTAGSVLERLGEEAVDPEWALELMLEEASNALAVGTAFDGLELVPEVAPAPAPAEPTPTPDGDVEDPLPSTQRPPGPLYPAPELPTEHVPTGFIWPAHTGRVALRALGSDAAAKELVRPDGQGSVRLAVGDFVLSTSQARRYDTAEAARQALVRAARERAQLGPLLAPETVLVAQPARDESTWLWTVLPRTQAVEQLAGSRDAASRTTLLSTFGVALVEALRVEAQHGVALELSPESFGVRHGLVRYTGEVGPSEIAGRDTGRALMGALVALSSVCDDLEPLVVSLESALGARLTLDELVKLARASTWTEGRDWPDGVRRANARIEEAFRRGRKAA